MIKKLSAVFICICFIISFAACSALDEKAEERNGKIKIVSTLFAQYDFARAIAGELADVTLLLSPGVESHTYEPSPADIIKIKNSDLFIYTGDHMESWAKGITDGLDTDKTKVLDISNGITLSCQEDIKEHHDEHTHQFDPHIWTSPSNAILMVQNITKALKEIDPENAAIYDKNANAYIEELKSVDNDFESMINSSKHKKIMFGGRFALYYFASHYELDYSAAYDSCSSETEPSAKLVANIIDEMRAENINVIYYEEMSNHTVADQIAAETGAQALLLHSCHNVSREELEGGETYISLMRQNLENLKKGLN